MIKHYFWDTPHGRAEIKFHEQDGQNPLNSPWRLYFDGEWIDTHKTAQDAAETIAWVDCRIDGNPTVFTTTLGISGEIEDWETDV